jgi:hypothetical protein
MPTEIDLIVRLRKIPSAKVYFRFVKARRHNHLAISTGP